MKDPPRFLPSIRSCSSWFRDNSSWSRHSRADVSGNALTETTEDQRFLLSKRWKMGDERFMNVFHDMVGNHLFEHFRTLGIEVIRHRTMGEDTLGQPLLDHSALNDPSNDICMGDRLTLRYERPNNHKPAFYQLHS